MFANSEKDEDFFEQFIIYSFSNELTAELKESELLFRLFFLKELSVLLNSFKYSGISLIVIISELEKLKAVSIEFFNSLTFPGQS